MTVGELIAKLSVFDLDEEVVFVTIDCGTFELKEVVDSLTGKVCLYSDEED